MTNAKSTKDAVGLETRNIFLDTQVYRAYGHNLGAGPLKVLAGYIAEGVFILHTTDVTLKEVSAQLDTMQADLVRRANKIAQELKRWNNRLRYNHKQLGVPDPLNPPVLPTTAYQDFEWTLLQDWKAVCHDAAPLPMKPIIDQYFSRQAPFDKDGSKEFPDAMALHALETWGQTSGEKCYVVSKDKAVQRAAGASDHLMTAASLDDLLSLLTSAQDHDIAEKVEDILSEQPLSEELQETIGANMIHFGGLYDGDKLDGEVHGIELNSLDEISSVTVLRIDDDRIACVVRVKLQVTAEISFDDISDAIWDNEDKRYFGVDTGWAEIENVVTAKLFLELSRDGDDFALSEFQFITRDITISDYFDDGYPYK